MRSLSKAAKVSSNLFASSLVDMLELTSRYEISSTRYTSQSSSTREINPRGTLTALPRKGTTNRASSIIKPWRARDRSSDEGRFFSQGPMSRTKYIFFIFYKICKSEQGFFSNPGAMAPLYPLPLTQGWRYYALGVQMNLLT